MIIKARSHTFSIDNKRGITHETFTRRYALAKLEDNLAEMLKEKQDYRQREKVRRLEKQIDKLKLSL